MIEIAFTLELGKRTNDQVEAYDLLNGLHIEKEAKKRFHY